MTRPYAFATLFIVPIGLMLLVISASAHDAFYPHHRQDLDELTRQRELRGPVLIITAVFVFILAGVLYVTLRKIGRLDHEHHETTRAHLEKASNHAAQAARMSLVDSGKVSEAVQAALAAYAKASRIAWNPNHGMVGGNSIRCKIGSDVVIVKISSQDDRYQIEVNASCDEADTQSILEVSKTNI